MKSLFNKLLLALSVALLTASTAVGQGSIVKTILPNTITNLLAGPYRIQSITVLSSDTAAGTSYFFDTARSSTNMEYPAYTNYVSSNIISTNIYTNTVGVITTNIFNAISTIPVPYAATTTAAPRIATLITVPTVQPMAQSTVPLTTALGLTYLSSVTNTVVIRYGPAF